MEGGKDRQASIAKIISERLDEKQREYYERYITIFDTAISFLKKKPIMLYGGLALDQYLPSNLKIYGEHELPDLDMFTSEPRKLARELSKHLKKKGFNLTSVGEALHEGTLKVYSEGLSVADITFLSKEAFVHLQHGSKKGSLGLPIVPKEYLAFTLHAQLSMSSIDRWAKVYDRIQRYYKAFPPKTSKAALAHVIDSPTEEISIINNAIHAYTQHDENTSTKPLLLGTPVLIKSLKLKPDAIFRDIPFNILMVPYDPVGYAQNMINQFPFPLTYHVNNKPEEYIFMPRNVVVKYKSQPVAIIFETAGACYGYNVYKDLKIATVHTAVMIYFAMQLSANSDFSEMTKTCNVLTAALAKVALGKMHKNDPFRIKYARKCMGDDHGLATLRRNRVRATK